ncbi:hypothetical protein NQZ68_021174 [Dissostichus eleginoides]|nr:hypothetical protein NQZ68_021174 [Dissostichus eleginoides]
MTLCWLLETEISAAKHYHLAMHVFGLRTQATTLWSRRKFSPEPTDRFSTVRLDNSSVVEQDCVNDIGPTPFQQHFGDLITKRVLDKSDEANVYFCPTVSLHC